MAITRKQYTQEFKDAAVKLLTEQGYTLDEASRNLGVNSTQLRRWRALSEEKIPPNDGSKSVSELTAELARLKKENHRLTLEREILKKAAAFFAKESGSGIN